MKTSPRISVITVVFNGEDHIQRTVESVLNQTYGDIQYIIVDGKSSDKTLDIIARFKDIDVVVSEPDRGLYDAMNKGLKLADGEYVWFLNAGDQVYKSDTIELMVSGMEGMPGVIYGGTMIIDGAQNEIGDRRLSPPDQLTWRSFRLGMVVCHQSILVRRDLAPEFNLAYRLSADFEWVIRATKGTSQIHNSKLILSRFLEGGLTDHNIKAGLKERFRIMRHYYGLVPTILRHFIFGVRLTNFYLKHRRI